MLETLLRMHVVQSVPQLHGLTKYLVNESVKYWNNTLSKNKGDIIEEAFSWFITYL